MVRNSRLVVSGPFCILLALMLLVLPLRWLLAAVVAAAFHEFCHWLAIRLCGGDLKGMYLGKSGAVMGVSVLSPGKELLCVLAGPVGGLLLLPIGRILPRVALCAAFQSIYNLLPIYPMDGGRAVRCLALLFFPGYADKVCRFITGLALAAICLMGLWGALGLGLGLPPLVMAAAIVLRSKKYLAKNPQTGYNGLD